MLNNEISPTRLLCSSNKSLSYFGFAQWKFMQRAEDSNLSIIYKPVPITFIC